MRVFLSHSSRDKGFVDNVASFLKPGTFELDAETFDAGLINSAAIMTALKRRDLFCLFLSSSSATSPYVDFETLLGVEFFARGSMARFLAVCLDEEAFSIASANVKFFNVVRRVTSEESTARLIQGSQIAAASEGRLLSHPFIGREDKLAELERQAIDPERPPIRLLFVSGNFGSGRRTLVRKFYQNQYPHVGRIFPSININEFSGLEELFRAVLYALRPSISSKEFRTRIFSFSAANEAEKKRQIAALLNSVLAGREAVLLLDKGGVLTDSGAFHPEVASIIALLESRPHPPVAIISARSVPLRFRPLTNDIAYVGVTALSRDESVRLASRLFKDYGQPISKDELSHVVSLADAHPYNFYRIVEDVSERGLAAFLANPTDFVEWKHRQSSEYIGKLEFTQHERLLLGILKLLPSLDFQAMVDALQLDPDGASDALMRLSSLHVLEHNSSAFTVSPPLRVAVERDRRIEVPKDLLAKALKVLSETLTVRIDEGTAEIGLVDTAVLAAIESGTSNALVSAFLLPSHYVWLAKRHYDQGHYRESIRLAKEGLRGSARLSSAGLVAACRYMCLPASRIGDVATFDEGIERLEIAANDEWARSNVAFLRGFNKRMRGNPPAAEGFFRDSYRLSPKNHSSARELAAICLMRGNLDEAERFAREARAQAQRNDFVIDILVAVLIRKLGRHALHDSEVRELLDLLEDLSEESGRSFFTTRKAELEHLYGDNRLARKLIEHAIDKTPRIFEPRRIYVDILLKDGNKTKAKDVIEWMYQNVNARDPGERRTNYRPYLETRAHYLEEIGRYEEAKEIFRDRAVFSEDEANTAVRMIEKTQAYRGREQ
jgi:tetratricopeptide (TPR) repeat protein